jgi:hypothetical protein
VSPGVFNTIHKLAGLVWDLHHDILHPAFGSPVSSQTIKDAIQQFESDRASFITHGAALDEAQQKLQEARILADDALMRYRFTETVIKKSRLGPDFNVTVEATAADQRWTYGVTSPQGSGIAQRSVAVTLEDGTEAFEVMVEVKTERFQSSRILTVDDLPLRADAPPTVHLDKTQLTIVGIRGKRFPTIVGWSLSCRTTHPLRKWFMLSDVGIMQSRMSLKFGVTGYGSFLVKEELWRCRIYYVSSDKIDFSMLRKYRSR